MLDQFLEAIAGARNDAGLDGLARKLWSANGEGQTDDAAAQAISEAIEARRAALEGRAGRPSGTPKASRRRDKMFGLGRPRALDRNAKVRIMHWARCLGSE